MKKLVTTLFLLLALSSTALAYNENTYIFVHRIFNPASGTHSLIIPQKDVELMGSYGCIEEPGWFSYRNSGDTIYMLGCEWFDDEIFTTSLDEVKALNDLGWYHGDVSFKSGGSLPIYRLYNPVRQQHLYTADESEYNTLGTQGWNQEGIAFYGVPANEVK